MASKRVSHTDDGGGCFDPTTLITMSDDTVKPICTLRSGEWVKSYDMYTNKWIPGRVGDVYEALVDILVTLCFDDVKLVLTPGHPVYARDGAEQGWYAGDVYEANEENAALNIKGKLKIGMELRQPQGWVAISDISIEGTTARVWNLRTVEPTHTFLADGVLVHNKGGCFLAGTSIKTPDGDVAIETLQAGDRVISYDLWAAREVTSEVGELQTTTRTEYYDLIIVFPDLSSGVLQLTPEHPVFFGDPGVATWASMDPDATMLANPELGRVFELEEDTPIRVWDAWANLKYIVPHLSVDPTPVYNLLNVGTAHTFFADEVLVHNKRYLPE